MTSRTTIILSVLLIATTVTARADESPLTLPRVFSSNMVLQRDLPVPIWGRATGGARITVTFADQTKTATADKAGKWRITLDKLKAAKTPRTLTVSSSIGNRQLKIDNVLVGEVWLASGQSNMERSVLGSIGGQEACESAKHPQIRLLKVPRAKDGKPADDVQAAWVVCSPKTIENFSGVAFGFGRHLHKELDVPVGLISAAYGAAAIQFFTPPVGYDLVERFKAKQVRIGGNGPLMFNAMIHPLIPCAIRGVIWYQGESNVLGGPVYDQRMLALIRGWRKHWGRDDLPFHYVQLAPCDLYDKGLLPPTWVAQQRVLTEPNTTMTVISDLVDDEDVEEYHPSRRMAIGRRLSLAALAATYGRNVPYRSPTFKSLKTDKAGHRLLVTFDHVYQGLIALDNKALTHFELAGPDGKFVPAKAEIVPTRCCGSPDTVVVSHPDVKTPRRVRFAWTNTARPNLANSAKFPVGAFRAMLP